MARRSSRQRERPEHGRHYPRVARVNEALREVIAEELELIDDDHLQLVTITGIDAEPDFRRATVWFSALRFGGTDDLDEVRDALLRHRVRLQAAIGRQLRLKRTPELAFRADPAILEGERIEAILRSLPPPAPEPAFEPALEPAFESVVESAEATADDDGAPAAPAAPATETDPHG